MTRTTKTLSIQTVIDYLVEAKKAGHTDVGLVGTATLFTTNGGAHEVIMATESQI